MIKKWEAYELAKKQLRWRERQGEEFDWDEELAIIIEKLML